MHENVEEIDRDVENLARAWQIFTDHLHNGRNADIHFPPALKIGSLYALQGVIGGQPIETTTEDSTLMLVIEPDLAAYYGAVMFAYGQSAMKNGILLDNMSPCDCGKLSEEDITKLIERKNDA